MGVLSFNLGCLGGLPKKKYFKLYKVHFGGSMVLIWIGGADPPPGSATEKLAL